MRAVITVIGKDTVGILAKVSAICSDYRVNIVDVSQTVMDDLFAMIMLTEIDKINQPFSEFVERMKDLGKAEELSIHVMHEDLFNSMHKV